MLNNNLSDTCTISRTPYQSGLPVDKIPTNTPLPEHVRNEARDEYRQLVGTFNLLSLSTRPDIAIITNMLSFNLNNATSSHVAAAKYVIRYLAGTKELGIGFNKGINHQLDSFVKFPVTQVTGLCDANWGPQDQSHPSPIDTDKKLELYKSCLVSGFLLWIGGPLLPLTFICVHLRAQYFEDVLKKTQRQHFLKIIRLGCLTPPAHCQY